MNREVLVAGCVAALLFATNTVAQQRGGPAVGPPTKAPTGQVTPDVAAKFVGDVGELAPSESYSSPLTSSLSLNLPAFNSIFMMAQNNGTIPQTCVILSSSNSYSAVAMESQPLVSVDGVFHIVVSGQASIANTGSAPDQKSVRVECRVFDHVTNQAVADCWGITGPQSSAGNFVRSNPNDTPHQTYGAFAGYAEAPNGGGTYRIRIRTFTNNWLGTFCYGNLTVHYNRQLSSVSSQ